jgi:hypothetical protein
VSKLSEIATEAELYNALVYVAQNQYAKMKESNKLVDDSEGSGSGFDTARSDLSDFMRNQSPRSDIYSPRDVTGSLVHSNSGSWDEHARAEGVPEVGDSYSYGESTASYAPDFNNLLNCMVAIRSTWGQYKRLDLFAQDFSLPEGLLSAAMQYVCETCGCRHLDPNVPVDRVANAVSLFYRSRFPPSNPGSARGSDPSKRSLPATSPSSTSGYYADGGAQQSPGSSSTQFRPFVQQRDPMHGRHTGPAPMHYQGQQQQQQFQHRGGYQGYPPNVPGYRNQQHYEDHSSMPQQSAFANNGFRAPAQGSSSMLAGKSKVPSLVPPASAPSMRYPNSNQLRPDGVAAMSSVVTPPSVSSLSPSLSMNSLNSQSPIAVSNKSAAQNNNMLSTYQHFWETVHQLFVSVYDARDPRSKTIDVLAELSALVLSGSPYPAAQMVVSLDAISSLACLDLVKKLEPNTGHQSFELVDSCVEAFTRLVVYPCSQVEGAPFPLQIDAVTKELQSQLFYLSTAENKLPLNVALPMKLTERFKSSVDDVLYSHIQPLLSPSSWVEVCEHIRFRLEAMVQIFQRDSNVHLFGGAVLGLHCQQDVVDFTALLPVTEMTEYKYLAKKRDLAKRIKSLEAALVLQLQTDAALGQLRLAIAHIRSAMAQGMNSPATSGPDGVAKARNMSKLNADVELICKFGERFATTIQGEVENSRRQPQLRALMEQLQSLRAQHAQIVNSLETTKTKEIEGLKSALSQFGYADVGYIENFSGHGLKTNAQQHEEFAIGFTDMDAPAGPMRCKVVVCHPLFVHSTRLLASYFNMDTSGKILSFIAIIKAFTAAHEINRELNAYAWNVLALHYLLNKKYLCCIQDSFLPPVVGPNGQPLPPRVMCGDIDVSFYDSMSLTAENLSNLAKVSIFELLFGFFKYYVTEFNVFDSVATLRDRGEVLSKSVWGPRSEARLWCLSIEDPLEHSGSPQPNDLGRFLTRGGLTQVRYCAFRFVDYDGILWIFCHRYSTFCVKDSIV